MLLLCLFLICSLYYKWIIDLRTTLYISLIWTQNHTQGSKLRGNGFLVLSRFYADPSNHIDALHAHRIKIKRLTFMISINVHVLGLIYKACLLQTIVCLRVCEHSFFRIFQLWSFLFHHTIITVLCTKMTLKYSNINVLWFLPFTRCTNFAVQSEWMQKMECGFT